MFRFACLAPLCLTVAGCAEIALPDLAGAVTAPAARSFPVQDAACVNAVRQEVRVADVRIQDRTPLAADAVSYAIAVGNGTSWACTATAAGATSAVGLIEGPSPGAPLTATAPTASPRRTSAPAATPAAAPATPDPVTPAAAPAAPSADPQPNTAATGPVILRDTDAGTAGPATLPAPDPRSTAPTEPLPAFN